MRETLRISAIEGYDPEIGRWLEGLEQVRTRTLGLIQTLNQWTLDWEGPDGQENAIGSLLYHIAYVEMSWLYMDIFLQDIPPNVKSFLPYDVATDEGRVMPVLGVSVDVHLSRLHCSRKILLESLRGMSNTEWHRLRDPENCNYRVTPAWAIFHLIEHEAGHTSQISSLKARAFRNQDLH